MSVDLDSIKNYLKVDHEYEDTEIELMVESSVLLINEAIGGSIDFSKDARWKLAIFKQVKEEYEHRGLSADTERHKLANGVENIIHQLRVKVISDDHT